MKFMLTTVLILALLCGGVLVLQVYLSRQKSRVLGLILPTISLLYATFMPLMMVVAEGASGMEIIFSMFLMFLVANIPTLVLLAIYRVCQHSLIKKAKMNKMNILDL